MDIDLRKQMVLIIRALYFQLEERWGMLTKDYKISTAQQHILYILFTNKTPLSITEISKIGCWHISTVTRLLKPLSLEKYIAIFQYEGNNKTKFVKITETGKNFIQEILTVLVQAQDFPYEICEFPTESVTQFLNVGLTILKGQKGDNFVHWLKEAKVVVNE